MRPIQSEDDETREFIVVPPSGEWFDSNHVYMAAELERRFPNMKFTVMVEGWSQDDRGFKLIPILGSADSNVPMLKWPSMEIVEDVLSCLAEFIVQSEKKPLLQ
ncbi:hypothetical protein SLT36_31480 (plasmid) [Aminobacter sp. BA135]|uniref:hypothetical protein n=1 Tax=Aminobacter sp. BA135 TaxID=537596 RepID=UPI003D7A4161